MTQSYVMGVGMATRRRSVAVSLAYNAASDSGELMRTVATVVHRGLGAGSAFPDVLESSSALFVRHEMGLPKASVSHHQTSCG